MVIKRNTYPCKDCLIKIVCSKICAKVLPSDYLFNFIYKNKCCPDCGHEEIVDCGGDEFGHMSNLIDSCASCIECGSLYFTVMMEPGLKLVRNRKHRKDIIKYDDDNKIMSFWYYLKSRKLITYKEYYK